MSGHIQFLGAAGTVTGSRFLLTQNGARFLVDCGLFQGGHKLKEANWEPFPVQPETLNAIFLTHAHIDHTGFLPRLVRQGYRGPIYATEATAALLQIMLRDSAHLQEQDAAYTNQKKFSHHQPALPLYTVADAENTLSLLQPIRFDQTLNLADLEVSWRPAGHLLGSAFLEIEVDKGYRSPHRIVFSGDLGRYSSVVMRPPAPPRRADTLVIESTYAGRRHNDDDIDTTLQAIVNRIIAQQGVLLIPAFAVGRTQQVLFHLRRLQDAGRIEELPIYIDSPMAVDASHLYCRFGDDHNLDINLLMDEELCPLRCRDTHFIKEVEASKELVRQPGPAIVISASGMCTGGRIKHHLKSRIADARNTVLFVGYQAEGTRGRWLLNGAKEIRIHGTNYPVRAHIASLQALSGHADHVELLHWLSNLSRPPQNSFIVHGESRGRLALQAALAQRGYPVTLPELGQAFALSNSRQPI